MAKDPRAGFGLRLIRAISDMAIESEPGHTRVEMRFAPTPEVLALADAAVSTEMARPRTVRGFAGRRPGDRLRGRAGAEGMADSGLKTTVDLAHSQREAFAHECVLDVVQ
jgi:hypothetical protein